ncbi:PHP domain-containing protein [Sedimentibacter sp. MB31-C6]|uniref:PHP domain-containing protein n=1 Tax=Sedimentibacter sp. MB31-C6 TaxID=3109366 RepID=UPI002DDD9A26|nr:PHP domain-containing protein [Sedimentibacter sp. MB36-C1]WSI04372.1 PHP domain-containing protein [Sedimentibacter sp. MB36-C1]
MKFYYDLHIHSDLSPCGNSDMTPNNIINMSYIKGLNIISITDHNTTKNLSAIAFLGKKMGIKVIPGIEVTTKEEVHILCYFKALDDALAFGNVIYDSLPNIKNNTKIFGEQNIYNHNEEKIGELDKLLINATSYSVEDIYYLSKRYHGITVPAHVYKKSNGILGVLGFIPIDLELNFIEVTSNEEIKDKQLKKYIKLVNSDAHQLVDISEPENFMNLDSIEDVYRYLKIY